MAQEGIQRQVVALGEACRAVPSAFAKINGLVIRLLSFLHALDELQNSLAGRMGSTRVPDAGG